MKGVKCEFWAKAKEEGAHTYFTGETCCRGHMVSRYTTNRNCVECSREDSRNSKEYKRLWYKKNCEHKKRKSDEWYRSNKQRKAVTVAKWRKENATKVKEIRRNHAKRNPEYVAAKTAIRRARLANACPKWADKKKIREVYRTARWLTDTTGIVFHVDHIIPLKNDRVCGLHTPENLRIIPAHQNVKKSNTFETA